MTELKTLKDLGWEDGEVEKSELREEAIKWLKWLNEASWEDYKDFHSSDEFGSGHEGLDHFIKTFFNLTEADLYSCKEVKEQ